jgi:hypothetical protein
MFNQDQQEIWRKMTEEHKPHSVVDKINGHSPPRVIPRHMLRGKSIEEVNAMINKGLAVFIPKNAHFTGTHQHKYAVRKNRS